MLKVVKIGDVDADAVEVVDADVGAGAEFRSQSLEALGIKYMPHKLPAVGDFARTSGQFQVRADISILVFVGEHGDMRWQP